MMRYQIKEKIMLYFLLWKIEYYWKNLSVRSKCGTYSCTATSIQVNMLIDIYNKIIICVKTENLQYLDTIEAYQ
jgi:hypothetical protein